MNVLSKIEMLFLLVVIWPACEVKRFFLAVPDERFLERSTDTLKSSSPKCGCILWGST